MTRRPGSCPAARRHGAERRDRGSGSVLVLALLAAAVALGAGVAGTATVVVARHRAESAADLAALAAAAGPTGADCASARRVASAQRADVLSCLLQPDGSVIVRVAVEGAVVRVAGGPAAAQARAGPPGADVTPARADPPRRVDGSRGRSSLGRGAGSG